MAPQALGFNDSCIQQMQPNTEGEGCASDPRDWPCVGPTNAFIYPPGDCAVCSDAKPCLFSILDDPSERHNLASQLPEVVAQLSKELATFKVYVSGGMSAAELGKYECLNTSVGAGVFPSPWWGKITSCGRGVAQAWFPTVPL